MYMNNSLYNGYMFKWNNTFIREWPPDRRRSFCDKVIIFCLFNTRNYMLLMVWKYEVVLISWGTVLFKIIKQKWNINLTSTPISRKRRFECTDFCLEITFSFYFSLIELSRYKNNLIKYIKLAFVSVWWTVRKCIKIFHI